jgi:hypothetical protein
VPWAALEALYSLQPHSLKQALLCNTALLNRALTHVTQQLSQDLRKGNLVSSPAAL